MQSAYAAHFEREMGCTEQEWLMWLPAAIGQREWRLCASQAHVTIAPGTLTLHWRTGEPRVIALMRMPRLHVSFQFDGLDAQQRLAFMKRFDLYMQRGGG
ncbi:MAG: hypothetical protein K0Q43_2269 [Ramlibacter sp.]|jgi:hypothetical protein|nr:hypothetical protein [Ramlibacter sp.]MDF2464034.1 hypothetical protein [Ramlibacter sp.]